MAKVSISKDDPALRERGWICVNDPACGAGCLLIAARNVCLSEGIGYRRVLFTAQDVDRIVALMCYVQLSLLGCAGYVVVGDSLLHPLTTRKSALLPIASPHHEIWFTPMYFDAVWQGRIQCAMLSQLLRESFCRKTVPAVAGTQNLRPVRLPAAESVPLPDSATDNKAELLADQSGQLRIF